MCAAADWLTPTPRVPTGRYSGGANLRLAYQHVHIHAYTVYVYVHVLLLLLLLGTASTGALVYVRLYACVCVHATNSSSW